MILYNFISYDNYISLSTYDLQCHCTEKMHMPNDRRKLDTSDGMVQIKPSQASPVVSRHFKCCCLGKNVLNIFIVGWFEYCVCLA